MLLSEVEGQHNATKIANLAYVLSWPLWQEPYRSGLSKEEHRKLLHQYLTDPASMDFPVWPDGPAHECVDH